jgi:hypothetical protein
VIAIQSFLARSIGFEPPVKTHPVSRGDRVESIESRSGQCEQLSLGFLNKRERNYNPKHVGIAMHPYHFPCTRTLLQ